MERYGNHNGNMAAEQRLEYAYAKGLGLFFIL